MGVHGLWDLLSPTGRRLPLETIRGKALAVDASVWLTQFVRAMRDSEGMMLRNAHLLGFFRRCIKLLFHSIRPVFVFDGQMPALKRRTLERRRSQHEKQAAKLRRVAEKLVLNRLKESALDGSGRQHALNGMRKGPGVEVDGVVDLVIWERDEGNAGVAVGAPVPPAPEIGPATPLSDDGDDDSDAMYLPEGDDLDVDALSKLPARLQVEAWRRRTQQLRTAHRERITNVSGSTPKDFSVAQIDNFLRSTKTLREIRNTRRILGGQQSAEKRVASDARRSYVFKKDDQARPTDELQARESARRQAAGARTTAIASRSIDWATRALKDSREKDGGTAALPIFGTQSGSRGAERGAADVDDLDWEVVDDDDNDDDQDDAAVAAYGEDEDTTLNAVDTGASPRREPEGPSAVPDSADVAAEGGGGWLPEAERTPDEEDDLKTLGQLMQERAHPQQPAPAAVLARAEKGEGAVGDVSLAPAGAVDAFVRGWSDAKGPKGGVLNAGGAADSEIVPVVKEEQVDATGLNPPRQDMPHAEHAGPSYQSPEVISDEEVELQRAIELSLAGGAAAEPSTDRVDLIDLSDETEAPTAEQTGAGDAGSGERRSAPEPTSPEPPRAAAIVEISESDHAPGPESLAHVGAGEGPIGSESAPPTKKPVGADRDGPGGPAAPSGAPSGASSGAPSGHRPSAAAEPTATGAADAQSPPLAEVPMDGDVEVLAERESEDAVRSVLADVAPDLDEEDIARMREEIYKEREFLEEEVRARRSATGLVSDEMYAETRDMLRLFGIPYIEAPYEAEAQCAWLNDQGLVDGVITEDSDAFLFGAKHVYRNIFERNKYVEGYDMRDVEKEMGLNRDKLIILALLLGSDYTDGIRGVGIVNATEILDAFPGMEGLREFRTWTSSVTLLDKEPQVDELNALSAQDAVRRVFCWKHRNVKRNWEVRAGFPNAQVVGAYAEPECDRSTSRFSWGKPDFDTLRRFCWEKFGWHRQKADEVLLPLQQELERRSTGVRQTQTKIDSFFKPERFAVIRSQRLGKAIKNIAGERNSQHIVGEPPAKKRSRSRRSNRGANGDTDSQQDPP